MRTTGAPTGDHAQSIGYAIVEINAFSALPRIEPRELDDDRHVGLDHAGMLRAAGHDVELLDSGCCGMAGAFGFQRAKYELSVALAERVLLPAVRRAPQAVVAADGFSCREQLRQLAGVRARHLAELLAGVPVLA